MEHRNEIKIIINHLQQEGFDEATLIGDWSDLGLWGGHREPIETQTYHEMAWKLQRQMRDDKI